jgi:hypothetical protein
MAILEINQAVDSADDLAGVRQIRVQCTYPCGCRSEPSSCSILRSTWFANEIESNNETSNVLQI